MKPSGLILGSLGQVLFILQGEFIAQATPAILWFGGVLHFADKVSLFLWLAEFLRAKIYEIHLLLILNTESDSHKGRSSSLWGEDVHFDFTAFKRHAFEACQRAAQRALRSAGDAHGGLAVEVHDFGFEAGRERPTLPGRNGLEVGRYGVSAVQSCAGEGQSVAEGREQVFRFHGLFFMDVVICIRG